MLDISNVRVTCGGVAELIEAWWRQRRVRSHLCISISQSGLRRDALAAECERRGIVPLARFIAAPLVRDGYRLSINLA